MYVVVRGQGQMLLGDEERSVSEGTLVFVPPGTEHAIRNTSSGLLVGLRIGHGAAVCRVDRRSEVGAA